MNSKYIFIFVMTLVVGSSFILFVNSESNVEVVSTPETTTSTQKTTTTSSTSTTVAPSTGAIGDEESVQIVDNNEETPNLLSRFFGAVLLLIVGWTIKASSPFDLCFFISL